ncbi:hypothetical protein CCAX7_62190 [Capsulimonas corticalis]|uniref:Uncharacterized protein n=1 Tax=Capsulimonas corticalis TaxID=2219043 RepID=A0A402CWI3_9BACT|nr:hypothetical protein [Capsulimonas corticalis]BDI34168.1 hypothetical protein CCAX7_62190 [Capsulimonas corticalis]
MRLIRVFTLGELLCPAIFAASLLSGVRLLAQTDIDFTLTDLAGVASSYELRRAQLQTARAQDKRGRRQAQRMRQVALDRQQDQEWLIHHRSQEHSVLASRRESGTRRQDQIQRDVPITFLQNLTFTFVTPQRQGVSGVAMRAMIHPARGSDRVVSGLTTDLGGHIRLMRVGPLPATVSFDREQATGASHPQDPVSEPEWEFSDPHAARFRLSTGIGRRIATYTVAASDSSSAKPERVASLIASRPFLRPLRRTVRKVMVFEDNAAPIVLERTVVDLDLTAPPGATATTPALPNQEFPVGDTGHVALRLPVAALADGPVTLRVGRILPGGEAETTVESYGTDPYSSNVVQAGPLRLARIDRCQITGGIGVLDTQAEIMMALGDKKRAGVSKEDDRGEWWDYGKGGLSVRMRKIASGATVAERIRLTSAAGGGVGGISVGDSWQSVQTAFGPADIETPVNGATSQFEAASYLDGGLRVVHDDKVRWIDIARPTPLLVEGTTAFVRREPARLFVKSFLGRERTPLSSKQDMEACLRRLPSVRIVGSEGEADLILTGEVADFTEKKENFLIGSLPFKYRCDTGLRYSLFDARTSTYVVRDKEVGATAGADYTKETIAGLIALGVLGSQKGDAPKLLGLVLGIAGAAELQRGVRNAVNRCPSIATRTACDTLSSDISRAADFSVRVTGVDYGRALLTINAGSEDGVRVSTPDSPCEFEVLVEGVPLPGGESGGKADYSTAVVVSAGPHDAVCELRRVRRRIDRFREKIDQKLDPDMARLIPAPASGAVSARATLRFPSVEVVPLRDLVSDDKADDALRQGALRLSRANEDHSR